MSLRSRLALTFAVASFAVIGTIAAVVYGLAATANRQQVATRLGHIATGVRDRLDMGMYERRQDVELLADVAARDARENPALLRRHLDQSQSAHPELSWIGYADTRGRVLAATRGMLEGADVSGRPWWSGALKEAFFGDVHEAPLLQPLLEPGTREPLRLVDIALPVTEGGTVVGVLGAHVGWAWARAVAERVLRNAGAVGQVELFVVDRSGKVLLGPRPTEGRSLTPPIAGSERPDGFGEHAWPDGRSYVSAARLSTGERSYPGLGWQVIARQPRESAFAGTDRLRDVLLSGGAAGVFVASLLGYVLAGRLAAPLERLAAAADRIGAGDRDVRFPEIAGPSEQGRLSAALRSMATRLEANEDRLRATVEERTRALVEAMNALEAERERLAYSLEGSRLATWEIDVEKGTITLSAEWARMMGGPPGETVANPAELLARVPEEEHAAIHEAVVRLLKGDADHYDVDHRVVRENATWMWIRSRGRVTRRSPGGRALRVNGTIADITPRKEAEREIRERKEQLQQLTDGVDSLIAHFDLDARLVFANRRYRDWFDIAAGSIPGLPAADFVGPEATRLLLSHMPAIRAGRSVSYEIVRTRAGETREFEVRLEPQRGDNGRVQGVYAVLNDITARKALERGLAREAHTDPVTALPNRRLFVDRLEVATARAKRVESLFALLYLDLDGFKPVNDTLGHDAGDELLRRVGERLSRSVRASDTVARVGGDEFALLLDPVAGASDAEALADKVLESLRVPFALTDGEARISASIGIALYPRDGGDASRLLRAADGAMYRAKADGKARAEFAA